MTPDQIHLLRKSFARVEPQAQIAVLSFYKRLFEMAPDLRPLFKTSIEAQATKFVEMLALVVHLTDQPASFQKELRQLGARHVIYGVKDEQYAMVGRALMQMLADVLGPEFTPVTRAAWETFYSAMATEMKLGSALVSAIDAHRLQPPCPVENSGTH